jgi:hypothetical protein
MAYENQQMQTLTHDDLTFVKIVPSGIIDVKKLDDFDGIILEYTSDQHVLKMIHKIRSDNDKSIYLKPVFIYKIYGDTHPSIAKISDGEITNLSDLETIATITRNIKIRS